MDSYPKRKWVFKPKMRTIAQLMNGTALEIEEQLPPVEVDIQEAEHPF